MTNSKGAVSYPIQERFYSFQGEGVHMGRPAFFIRTYGCPVHCDYCDSAGTWHKDYVPPNIPKMSVAELVAEALEANPRFVVITGGEPTVHNLAPLCGALAREGLKVHLETSGAFPIKGAFTWVTLSPKRWKLPLLESVALADEFKIIVEAPEDIDFYLKIIIQGNSIPSVPIWLHPEWSHREDPKVLNAIIEAVKGTRLVNLRAGWQLHKLFLVDQRDRRTQPAVPLGGNPAKGPSI